MHKPNNNTTAEVKTIISEHKQVPHTKYGKTVYRPKPGMKRVMAIVKTPWGLETRHMDVQR